MNEVDEVYVVEGNPGIGFWIAGPSFDTLEKARAAVASLRVPGTYRIVKITRELIE